MEPGGGLCSWFGLRGRSPLMSMSRRISPIARIALFLLLVCVGVLMIATTASGHFHALGVGLVAGGGGGTLRELMRLQK